MTDSALVEIESLAALIKKKLQPLCNHLAIKLTKLTEAQVLAKQKTGFHSVMFNPVNPRFLVSANSEEGIALWDCRKPKE